MHNDSHFFSSNNQMYCVIIEPNISSGIILFIKLSLKRKFNFTKLILLITGLTSWRSHSLEFDQLILSFNLMSYEAFLGEENPTNANFLSRGEFVKTDLKFSQIWSSRVNWRCWPSQLLTGPTPRFLNAACVMFAACARAAVLTREFHTACLIVRPPTATLTMAAHVQSLLALVACSWARGAGHSRPHAATPLLSRVASPPPSLAPIMQVWGTTKGDGRRREEKPVKWGRRERDLTLLQPKSDQGLSPPHLRSSSPAGHGARGSNRREEETEVVDGSTSQLWPIGAIL